MEQRSNNRSSIDKGKFNEICNKTTKQMKSASDMILFSESGTKENYIFNKTTVHMASEGDLIKFSKD